MLYTENYLKILLFLPWKTRLMGNKQQEIASAIAIPAI